MHHKRTGAGNGCPGRALCLAYTAKLHGIDLQRAAIAYLGAGDRINASLRDSLPQPYVLLDIPDIATITDYEMVDAIMACSLPMLSVHTASSLYIDAAVLPDMKIIVHKVIDTSVRYACGYGKTLALRAIIDEDIKAGPILLGYDADMLTAPDRYALAILSDRVCIA